MVSGAARGTTRLADAAATGNVAGQTTQLGGLLDLLRTGGALAMDPQLRAQYDALQASVAKSTAKPLKQVNKLQSQIANLSSKPSTPGNQKKLRQLQGKLTTAQSSVAAQQSRVTDFERTNLADAPRATDMLREQFPELAQTLADAEPFLGRMGQLGAAGERLMETLGRGYQANEVGRGEAGEALYGRATEMARSDGRLSPEAAREAVQSARQAFSSRGLGTSAGSVAAELLNRDSYSRQRMFEDLGFANQITQQDQARQFGNEQTRLAGNQMNVGMLGQAFTTDRMVNQEGLGAALQRGQLAGAANPANMLMGMYGGGQPTGSQALGPASNLASNWANNQVQANMFNANSQMWANAANNFSGGGSGGGGTGQLVGQIAGGVLGGAAGYFAGGGNPMFAMGGYQAGSQIGGGIGGQFR